MAIGIEADFQKATGLFGFPLIGLIFVGVIAYFVLKK